MYVVDFSTYLKDPNIQINAILELLSLTLKLKLERPLLTMPSVPLGLYQQLLSFDLSKGVCECLILLLRSHESLAFSVANTALIRFVCAKPLHVNVSMQERFLKFLLCWLQIAVEQNIPVPEGELRRHLEKMGPGAKVSSVLVFFYSIK